MLYDDIDSAPVRQPHDLGADVLRVVIDHLAGAERARTRELLRRSGGGEHARAVHARNLSGGLADAAARGQHEHVVAALQARQRDQHMPRREERQRKGSGFDESDLVRNRNQILHRHFHVLGVAARVAAISEHFVPRAFVVPVREARFAAAAAHAGLQHHAASAHHVGRLRGDHFARDVTARDVRHRELHVGKTAALPDVEMIQRARAHADEHVARFELGLGSIFEAQHVGTAVLVETNGFHRWPERPVYQKVSGNRIWGSPRSSRARFAPAASGSPTMSVRRRAGSTCRVITRDTSSQVTRSIDGTKVTK